LVIGHRSSRLPDWLPLSVFPLLALLLLWEVLVGGRVLLPAEYLNGFSPWGLATPAGVRESLPQWNALQWDGMAEFYPWRLFAARSMSAGYIPLWNPHVLAGTPFLANSQSAPLYPLHAFYYLPLGTSIAVRMGWAAFLHLSLAGTFAYLLARDLGARRPAALIGGAAFELSGFAIAWLELPSFLSVSCWIPLVLLCIGRAVRLSSWRWLAGGGTAAGMMLLAGHLQLAFYGLLAAGCVWLWEVVAGWAAGRRQPPAGAEGIPQKPTRPLPAIAMGIVFIAVALALAAPQMLPSLELSRISHRLTVASEQGYAGYVGYAMPPRNWIALLVPDYYGLPVLNNFWGLWNYGAPNVMEYAGHVGAAAFVFVIVGLVWGRRISPRVWLFGGIALLALLLATGTPLNRLLYFYVPGFAQTGSPARVLVLFCLAQAMLSALGSEWVLRKAGERWSAAALPLGAGLLAVLALMGALHLLAVSRLPSGSADDLTKISLPALQRAAAHVALAALLPLLLAWLFRENRPAHRVGAMAGAGLLVIAGALLLLGGAYNLTAPAPQVYPDTPLTRSLTQAGGRVATINEGADWGLYHVPPALLPPNASIAYGWRDAQGYDSLALGSYRRLANALAGSPEGAAPQINGNIVFIKNAHSPLLPLLATPWIVSRRPITRPGLAPAPGFPPGPPYVYHDKRALPEAYTVSHWTEAGREESPDQLLPSTSLLRATAVIAPLNGRPRQAAPGTPTPLVPATVERSRPGHLLVRAAPSRPSLLVLAEACAPGWTAAVHVPDAPPRRLPIYRTNIAFQGVVVPPGPAVVEWRYEPASFRVGLFFALAAMAGLLAACFSCKKSY
jgi:hypothetical protein